MPSPSLVGVQDEQLPPEIAAMLGDHVDVPQPLVASEKDGAGERDKESEREAEAEAQQFEGCFPAQGPHQQGATTEPTAPGVGRPTTRKRRRDGKVVARSHIDYHFYKINRRLMKKRSAYYLRGGEDRTRFTNAHAGEWTCVRSYQCKLLLRLLVGRNKLAQHVADAVQHEVDAVNATVERLAKEPPGLERRNLGQSSTWTSLLIQQHTAMARENPNDRGWCFSNEDDAEKVAYDTLLSEWQGEGILKEDDEVAKRYLMLEPTGHLQERIKQAETLSWLLDNTDLSSHKQRPTEEPSLYEAVLRHNQPIIVAPSGGSA